MYQRSKSASVLYEEKRQTRWRADDEKSLQMLLKMGMGTTDAREKKNKKQEERMPSSQSRFTQKSHKKQTRDARAGWDEVHVI
jgi:hypothetical protein